jgi:hypothetical protein
MDTPESAPSKFRQRFATTVCFLSFPILLIAVVGLPFGFRYAEDVRSVNPDAVVAWVILFLGVIAFGGVVGEVFVFCVTRRRAQFLFRYCVTLIMMALAFFILTMRPQARRPSKLGICINNLRQIDGAKLQWALETKQPSNAIPVVADLAPYLGRGRDSIFPACPAKGIYIFHEVYLPPTCSVKGHGLE